MAVFVPTPTLLGRIPSARAVRIQERSLHNPTAGYSLVERHNANLCTVAVLLDGSKPFGRVALSRRTFRISVDRYVSSEIPIRARVPQDIVQGVVLNTAFTNDSPVAPWMKTLNHLGVTIDSTLYQHPNLQQLYQRENSCSLQLSPPPSEYLPEEDLVSSTTRKFLALMTTTVSRSADGR